MRRTLAAADPQNVQLKNRLGRALQGLAWAEMTLPAHLADAVAHAEEGVAIARETLKAAPDVVARTQLADALATLGAVESKRGRGDAACRAFRNAQEAYNETTAEGDNRGLTQRGLAACAAK